MEEVKNTIGLEGLQDVFATGTSDSNRTLVLYIPSEEVGFEMNKMARDMAKSLSLPGFRKGKTPLTVIQRKFKDDLINDSILKLSEKRITELVNTEAIKPLSRPLVASYRKNEENGKYESTIRYEEIPPIDISNFYDDSFVMPVLEFTEADIDTIIERWQRSEQAYEPTDTPVQSGDWVSITVDSLVNGESKWNNPQKLDLIIAEEDDGLQVVKNACLGKSKDDYFSFDRDQEVSRLIKGELSEDESNRPSVENEFRILILDVQRPISGELNADFLQFLEVKSRQDDNFRAQVRVKAKQLFEKKRDQTLNELMLTSFFQQNTFMPPLSMIELATTRTLRGYGWSDETINKERYAKKPSAIYETALLSVVGDLRIDIILQHIEKDRHISIDQNELKNYLERKIQERAQDRRIWQDDDEIQRCWLENCNWSDGIYFRLNHVRSILLQETNLTEEVMNLTEFETWYEQNYYKGPNAVDDEDDLDPMDDDPPMDSELMRAMESLDTDLDDEAPVDESTSIILDAAGTPMKKPQTE